MEISWVHKFLSSVDNKKWIYDNRRSDIMVFPNTIWIQLPEKHSFGNRICKIYPLSIPKNSEGMLVNERLIKDI